ncbi:hypothetical protein [Paenibacillus sp. MMO-177]|uniref:hypothetical protein n=1 Tax=Paenibacillus sp. MMO-177 TaxID=3081289 RepID=UPI00301A1A4A
MVPAIKRILEAIGDSKSNYGLEYTSHSIIGLRRNWDFEVLTKSIFDFDGNEYLTEESIPASVKASGELQINEEPINTDWVFRLGDKVDVIKAKQCGFGVIRMLKGDHEGELFMYYIEDTEPQIQLLGYQALVYGTVHNGFRKLVERQEGENYVKMVLGRKIGELVVGLLRADNQSGGG